MKPIRAWLLFNIILILVMIAIGGITRLTGSGLSMVDWKPIMGAVPPSSEDVWLEKFEQYKQFPQYQSTHAGLSLDQFKKIFFWEYLHRLLGRLIGLAYAVPFFFFLMTRQVQGRLAWKLLGGLLLGGLQGLLGWYMVKSGLVDKAYVSHYRLAAHLLLALGVMAYLFWIWLDLNLTKPVASPVSRRARITVHCLLFTLILQITYGAFTAGLKAGYSFNTFPLMGGTFIPSGFTSLEPLWINLFQNPATVQFIHRWLGLLFFAGLLFFVILGFQRLASSGVRRWMLFWLMISLVQVVLGIITLVLKMPVTIAVIHQVNAAVMVLIGVGVLHSMKNRRPISESTV